jgi:DNA-binding MarR family transcriptional regulator
VDALPGTPTRVDDETLDRSDASVGRGNPPRSVEVDHAALATFRYLIRSFLATSERFARAHGLNPQQHQCLLALAGQPPEVEPTIGYIAARLLIEHHSAVGLVDRLVGQGLVERRTGAADRRQVEVHLTERGAAILEQLSVAHRDELHVLAPRLVDALASIVGHQ